MFLDAVDEGVAESMLAHLRGSTAQVAAVQLRVLGGAVSRVPSDETAYAHRSRRILAAVAALDAAGAGHDAWAQGVASTLHQGEPGAYVNFVGDEGDERVRDAYPGATYARLAAIKGAYDPENLFRLNQNVRPE